MFCTYLRTYNYLLYLLLVTITYLLTTVEVLMLTLGLLHSSMQSVQNLGLAVISILAGLIVDKSGYMMLEMFYMIWLCSKWHTVFIAFGLALKIYFMFIIFH